MVTTLILSSVLALVGIFFTGKEFKNMGENLGSSTRDSVRELVEKREKDHLEELVHEKVGIMDGIFNGITKDTEVLSESAADILSAPQDYMPKTLIRSKSLEEGWSLSLALTPEAVLNLESLREKIGLAANIQSYLKSTARSYSIGCSVYTAFEDGFDIVIDTNESDMRNHYFDNPKSYREFNFKERDWYKNAKEKRSVVFSDTLLNSNNIDDSAIIVCSAPIIVNGETVGVSGMGFFAADIGKIVLKTSTEESGFCFLMNKSGQVIVSPKSDGDLAIKDNFPDLRTSSEKSLAKAAEEMAAGKKGLMPVIVDGEEYFLAFESLKIVDWRFGALIKVSNVTAPADFMAVSIDTQTKDFINRIGGFARKFLPLMIFAFIILFVAISILSDRLTKTIVKPIQMLADGVREISSGNFDKKIDDIKTGDEIEHLAICFNAMTDELKTYMTNLTKVTAEKERVATELNVATDIQLSMLPHDFDFNRADFEIYATMHAAKEVGGDFYDFYLLDENHLMITIADVSGKGVPAALFMAISKVILKNFALTMKNPDELGAVMTLANQQLCQGNDEMMFVTVFMGMLDLKTGKFIYVNGGHNPPLVMRNGKFEYLSVKQNCVLGMMDEMDYEQQEIQLEKGDVLYLYTDGVTEAMDEEQNQYGEERLLKCLNEKDSSCDLQKLLEHVKEDLNKHVGAAAQSDDITMLAVRFNG